MTAEYLPARIRDRHVQMSAIGRDGACEGQYFEVAANFRRRLRASEPQCRNVEAADALDDEGRLQVALTKRLFDGDAKVVVGRESEGMSLHAWAG